MLGWRPLRRPALRFLREERGNAAVIFALVLLPLIAGAGLAIDTGLAFTVEERLQKALDAAGLAAGQTSVQANIVPDARAFFRSNFDTAPELATAADPVVQVSSDGTEITLTASATMPTRFMRLFGQDSVTVSARSVINKQTRGLELALVLDVTGSMVASNKIGGLKTAANDLINILYRNRETVPNLWVSVVPYTGVVNVGTTNSSFLSASDAVNVSPAAFAPDTWAGCVLARVAPRDLNDDPPSAARFSSYLHPDRPDPPYSNWFDNDWGTGRSPEYAKTPASDSGVQYWEGYGPNQLCPDPVLPLVAEKSRIINVINNLRPWHKNRGATHTNIGLAWGWRTLSPRWRGLWDGSPASLPLNYNTSNMDKVVVVLTDGDNTMLTLNVNGTVESRYTSYALADLGVTSTNASRARTDAEDELDRRTTSVCNMIKTQGIIIYSITFGSTPSSAIQTLLRNCATVPGNYWHSDNNATLRGVFQAIGNQLSNLRIKR